MTPQELKEIEARANEATPGPWIASFTRCGTGMGYNSYAHQVRIGTHEHTVAHSEVVTGDVVSTRRSQTLVNPTNAKPTLEPDADFIAHARSDIPNLLAHIATQAEALKVAVEALKKYSDPYKYEDRGMGILVAPDDATAALSRIAALAGETK